MRYKTKPYEIEAVQWEGANYAEIFSFIGNQNHSIQEEN